MSTNDQPSVTIINIDSETTPTIFRADKGNVGSAEILLRIAKWLKDEDALIVNLTVSPTNLCVVAALKQDWMARFGPALHGA